MYKVSTNNKEHANRTIAKIDQELIDLKLQKARIESDLLYYTLLEKELSLSKEEKVFITADKKNLSLLRQVIDFFNDRINSIILDNDNNDEKKTAKATKSTRSIRRT